MLRYLTCCRTYPFKKAQMQKPAQLSYEPLQTSEEIATAVLVWKLLICAKLQLCKVEGCSTKVLNNTLSVQQQATVHCLTCSKA